MNPRVSHKLSVARLRRWAGGMATFSCQSQHNNGVSEALCEMRVSVVRGRDTRTVSFHAGPTPFPSPEPILRLWQHNAGPIAGSLHKSISSAWPSAAVGGHVWEHDFNVFATGDWGCVCTTVETMSLIWLTHTTNKHTMSQFCTDFIFKERPEKFA